MSSKKPTIVTRLAVSALALWAIGARDTRAAAPSHVLRIATIAPEGSMWGRLLIDLEHEVGRDTGGSLHMKWTWGGAAGDEVTALDRVRRHQLDGEVGAAFCQRVAPTLRVLEVTGLVQTDEEAAAILRKLRPDVDRDFEHTPFEVITLSSGFGHRMLFSRTPVRSLDELRRGRYWVYELDDVEHAQYAKMGVHLEPSRPEQAAQRFDAGKLDGFISLPYAAVAYRYSTRARYFTDLDAGFLPGCFVVARDTFAQLSPREREALRRAGARLEKRFEQAGRAQDQALRDHLLAKQGLKAVPMSSAFRQAFIAAARLAGDALGPALVPTGLIDRVRCLLMELRGEPEK